MAKANDGQGDVLNTKLLKARITNLEYGDVDDDGNFIPISVEDIRRIYIEETGENPPSEILLYRSDDFKSKGSDSGFDGTVIHFFDAEKGVNESYTIPRGTESREIGGEGDGQPLDFAYDVLGIFTGNLNDQLEDAENFEKWAHKEIKQFTEKKIKSGGIEKVPEVKKILLGHSLGGSLAQMLYLVGGDFESVVVFNDAAPTVYELAENDLKFFKAIKRKYGGHIKNPDELYDLDPKDLQAFGLDYYKLKGEKIHHITSEEDLLYPLKFLRGFIRLGSEHVIDTNPEFAGLHNMMKRIPDRQIQSLQKYLAGATPYYEEAGMDGLLYYLAGMDKKFLENMNIAISGVKGEAKLLSFEKIGRRLITAPLLAEKNRLVAFNEMRNQLPFIWKQLKQFLLQIPSLILIADAMTGEEGERISNSLRSMQKRGENALAAIDKVSKLDITTLGGFMEGLKELKKLAQALSGMSGDMVLIWGSIKQLKSELFDSAEAHGIEAIINGLSESNRRYEGNDLIYFTGGGAAVIEVNISSATRLYWLGIDNYEKKRLVLERIQKAYVEKFEEPYEWRRRDLLTKIRDMESDPHSYSYLLSGANREMVSISVQEFIPSMPSQITEAVLEIEKGYTEDIAKGNSLFRQMKDAIIQLFSEDQQLTAIFNLR